MMTIFGRPSDKVLEAIELYEFLEAGGLLEEISLKARIAANKKCISKTIEDTISMQRQLEKLQN
jgi:hypothetical protein